MSQQYGRSKVTGLTSRHKGQTHRALTTYKKIKYMKNSESFFYHL